MEKKYIIGYYKGQEAVGWEDVKNFRETVDDDGNVTVYFEENGIPFTYYGNDVVGYDEVDGKAPHIGSYKYIGRRTALRHNYLDPRRKSMADPDINYSEFSFEDEDDEDIDDMLFGEYEEETPAHCGGCGYSHQRYSCGGGGC